MDFAPRFKNLGHPAILRGVSLGTSFTATAARPFCGLDARGGLLAEEPPRFKNRSHAQMIDDGGRSGETAGMDEMNPEPRRFQFTLRKLLLWTVVVALGLCVLSPLQPWVIIVVLIWFTVIFIMRWALSSKWAAVISFLMAELPFGWLFCCEWLTGARGFETAEPAFSGAIIRGVIGFGSFLLVEVAWQAVNWIDGIGQADGE